MERGRLCWRKTRKKSGHNEAARESELATRRGGHRAGVILAELICQLVQSQSDTDVER